ncbi:RNA exonuclease [Grosmannia clavigera kw1407]|uniref:RNA exonuclease n=1 Tax=Grosmannia clavigera (strain kw1407 / UAMH 11150) TaxID=655863 RepID=F0XUZ8_GROCL|nr:RNA exonuclease [Grosmannia clavigera kw1407]EFW98733.1 RNA exonuclease [Grosmannia clavigera kw1407]
MADPWAPLVWIDCEMTGLDPDSDQILEIYCLVTDGHLRPVVPDDPGWGAVVHVPDAAAALARMDAWCTDHHGASGLTEAVLASTISPEAAAAGLLAYVRARVPTPRVALLAGNSVHADRAFLRRQPYAAVIEHLHYRILDVSTIKEAAARWLPGTQTGQDDGDAPGSHTFRPPPKTGTHRAREDILESIAEARFYKDTIFARSQN